MKKTLFIVLIIILSVLIVSMREVKTTKTLEQKPVIAISTFSLYDITKHIAQSSVDIFMILPFGVDAHSYEPTPKQVVKLYKSDLVLYSGAGLEPWISGFEFKNKAIDMSRHVELHEIDEHNHEHHDHGDEKTNVDPHYWLDFQNMIKAAQIITKELVALFPKNRDLYIKNRDTYIAMLKKLDSRYKETLSECKLNTIIVNHNAFSYISSRYGFEVEALSGLSPEAQPSAKSMANLIEHVKEYKLKTVFFESFVSDKAMKSIAKDAKVGIDVLHPLGNITADEARQKLTYEDIMMSNLQKISTALECR